MDPFDRVFGDPQFHVTCAIITWTAALYCLLAFWAVMSRRHWFVRGIAVLVALAALLPIRAHEPLILLAMVSAELIAFVACWRLWKEWRAPAATKGATADAARPPSRFSWRFGLLDLLLFTALAAGGAWIATQCLNVGLLLRWPDVLVASLLMTIMALAGYVSQIHPLGWWPEMRLMSRKLVVFLPMMISAAAADTWLLGNWLHADNFLWIPRRTFPPLTFCILLVAYAQVGIWILLVTGNTAELRIPGTSTFRKTAAIFTLGAVGIGVAGVLGWLYWQMAAVTRFPPYPPMAENVYPQVRELARRQPSGDATAETAWLKEMLALLNRPGRVEYDPATAALDRDYFNSRSDLTRVGWTLERKAEQLHASGRHDEAVRVEMALIKLAGMQMKGGRSYDLTDGISLARRSGLRIHRYHHEHSDETLAAASELLGKVEAGREPWQIVMMREDALNASHYRWRRSLLVNVHNLTGQSGYATPWDELDNSQRAIMGSCGSSWPSPATSGHAADCRRR